jgi:hypothetical protein
VLLIAVGTLLAAALVLLAVVGGAVFGWAALALTLLWAVLRWGFDAAMWREDGERR